jgi:1-acyl-sn-glycerol-3-phosphate acyltransferase
VNREGVVSIDGFRSHHDEDAFVAFDAAAAQKTADVLAAVGRRMHVEVSGIERIPPGKALIVANHTFGFDIAFAMAAVAHDLRRPVFALGEHAWWRFPFLRRAVAAIGTVDGTRANADRLLSGDNLVVVLPGGLRESVKPHELRYRLLWGHRYGFIRASLRHGAPIVPLAAIGGDDIFDLAGNAFRRGERILRRSGFPIPLPAHLLPIPHLVRLRFVFGEPIAPPAPPEAECDERVTVRYRHEVEGALHELIETELAKRCGVDVD